MRYFESVKAFLSRSVVLYGIAFVVLWGVADHHKAAIERLNSVLEWGDYPARLDAGKDPLNERQLRMAVRYYKIVADILPQSDQPLAAIGYCYARLGEDRLAAWYYQQALRRQPGHFWHEYDLGVLYFRDGDFTRAAASFQKVAGLNAEEAARNAILAPLSRMPAGQRQLLFGQAVNFASGLRQVSSRMAVVAGVPEARKAIGSGDIRVVMHPWAYSIQPGKENYF